MHWAMRWGALLSEHFAAADWLDGLNAAEASFVANVTL